MTRSLLLTIALAISCVGGGVGTYLAGRSSGPDLIIVARAGTLSGTHSGTRAGTSAGQAAGYRAGYSAAFRRAYPGAYRAAYRRAVGQ